MLGSVCVSCLLDDKFFLAQFCNSIKGIKKKILRASEGCQVSTYDADAALQDSVLLFLQHFKGTEDTSKYRTSDKLMSKASY